MHDRIDAGERGSNGGAVAHVAAHQLEALVAIERQQGFPAIDELIEDSDAIPGLEQMRGHARAEIPGATGNKDVLFYLHVASLRNPMFN